MIENEAFSSAGVGLPVLRVSWFQLSGFGAFGSKVFGFRGFRWLRIRKCALKSTGCSNLGLQFAGWRVLGLVQGLGF